MHTQTLEGAPAAQDPSIMGDLLDPADTELSFSLQDFVTEFGDELLDSLNRANPPVYSGVPRANRQVILASLKRQLFPAQAEVVHAAAELLVNQGERAAIVNGEMGTGKTTVGIALAAVLNAEGYRRTLAVKGDTYKQKVTTTEYRERDDGSIAETRILTDKFVPVIRAWDLSPDSATLGRILTIH